MIDFKEMVKRQKQGVDRINSLSEDEGAVLRHFCSLAAEGINQAATKRNAPLEDTIFNGYINGVALGLQLIIENGEVK
jgi:hypothetical protein